MTETPTILACAWLGDHAVDLWAEKDAWCAGNDDRSVVGTGPTADAALDAYLFALGVERLVFGEDAGEGEELDCQITLNDPNRRTPS